MIHPDLGAQDLVEELAGGPWYRPRAGWNEAPPLDDKRTLDEKYYSLPIFSYYEVTPGWRNVCTAIPMWTSQAMDEARLQEW